MAGDDIAMNEFKVLTNMVYVYGEAPDTSQGKMKTADLLGALFQYRGSIDDSNFATETGFYRISSEIQNMPYDGYGIMLVFKAGSYILQIYSGASKILVRKSGDNGTTWIEWKSVTLT